MPFGMIAPEQYAWFYYGGGMDLMKKVYDKHGVYAFPGGNTGNQMGGWFRKEINSVDDLKGLKMRIPGLGGEVALHAAHSDVGALLREADADAAMGIAAGPDDEDGLALDLDGGEAGRRKHDVQLHASGRSSSGWRSRNLVSTWPAMNSG